MLLRLPTRNNTFDNENARTQSDKILYLIDNLIDDIMVNIHKKNTDELWNTRYKMSNKKSVEELENNITNLLQTLQNMRTEVHNFYLPTMNKKIPITTYKNWVQTLTELNIFTRAIMPHVQPLIGSQKTFAQMMQECKLNENTQESCVYPCYISRKKIPYQCSYNPKKNIIQSIPYTPNKYPFVAFSQVLKNAPPIPLPEQTQSPFKIHPRKETLENLHKMLFLLEYLIQTQSIGEIEVIESPFRKLLHTFLFELPTLTLSDVIYLKNSWNSFLDKITILTDMQKKKKVISILTKLLKFHLKKEEYRKRLEVLLDPNCYKTTLQGKGGLYSSIFDNKSNIQKQRQLCKKISTPQSSSTQVRKSSFSNIFQ